MQSYRRGSAFDQLDAELLAGRAPIKPPRPGRRRGAFRGAAKPLSLPIDDEWTNRSEQRAVLEPGLGSRVPEHHRDAERPERRQPYPTTHPFGPPIEVELDASRMIEPAPARVRRALSAAQTAGNRRRKTPKEDGTLHLHPKGVTGHPRSYEIKTPGCAPSRGAGSPAESPSPPAATHPLRPGQLLVLHRTHAITERVPSTVCSRHAELGRFRGRPSVGTQLRVPNTSAGRADGLSARPATYPVRQRLQGENGAKIVG